MFSTSYYSIFSSEISFLGAIFLPVIVAYLVVIFINCWMVIFYLLLSLCYFIFGSKGSKQRKAEKSFSSEKSDVSCNQVQ